MVNLFHSKKSISIRLFSEIYYTCPNHSQPTVEINQRLPWAYAGFNFFGIYERGKTNFLSIVFLRYFVYFSKKMQIFKQLMTLKCIFIYNFEKLQEQWMYFAILRKYNVNWVFIEWNAKITYCVSYLFLIFYIYFNCDSAATSTAPLQLFSSCNEDVPNEQTLSRDAIVMLKDAWVEAPFRLLQHARFSITTITQMKIL